jgi:hypothetical protein
MKQHIKFILVISLMAIALSTKGNIAKATIAYHPTGYNWVIGMTQDTPSCTPNMAGFPYSCSAMKSFNFVNPGLPKTQWPTMMQVVGRIWSVDTIVLCVDQAAARCASNYQCSGPGFDIWNIIPANFSPTWAWQTTRHTYDWDANFPYYSSPYAGDFYTAYLDSWNASFHMFVGDLNPVNNCPAIRWYPAPPPF